MAKKRTLAVVAGTAASFIAFVAVIIVLFRARTITSEEATLMLVALLGLYIGFGILIAIYRLIAKLE